MGDSGSKAAEIEWYPIPMLVATRRPDTASELRYDKKEEGEWEEEREKEGEGKVIYYIPNTIKFSMTVRVICINWFTREFD